MQSLTETTARIDHYIASFPAPVQTMLQQLRKAVQQAAPQSVEKWSYQMPTFFLKGNLVHFAAYKNHIGLYPAPSAIIAFQNDLKVYKTSKGAIQFPLAQPLPLELIKKIVKYRVKENLGLLTK